jgi:DNA-binding transcriptional MerR regulator
MKDILNLDRRARSSDDLRVFTVGAFGRLAGVSAKVLRTYDAAGLFRPAWVDPASGYRYYSPAQLPSLRRLLALRELGLGRADLVEAIRGEVDLRAALERRRAALEAERVAVERRLAMLDIRVGQPEEPDVVVRRLDPELVATFHLRDAPGDDIGAAFHELEAHIRDLGVRAPSPPGAIPDEDLIYVPVRRLGTPTERIAYRRLPVARAATLLHRGSYASLPAAFELLGAWVARSGQAPAAPLRILYLQFGAEADLHLPRGWTVERDEDFATELQQPIA